VVSEWTFIVLRAVFHLHNTNVYTFMVLCNT